MELFLVEGGKICNFPIPTNFLPPPTNQNLEEGRSDFTKIKNKYSFCRDNFSMPMNGGWERIVQREILFSPLYFIFYSPPQTDQQILEGRIISTRENLLVQTFFSLPLQKFPLSEKNNLVGKIYFYKFWSRE